MRLSKKHCKQRRILTTTSLISRQTQERSKLKPQRKDIPGEEDLVKVVEDEADAEVVMTINPT
jgi:hypothetical protein